MSNSINYIADNSIEALLNDGNCFDFSSFSDVSTELIEQFYSNEGFENVLSTFPFPSAISSPPSNPRTPSGFLPENNSNSNHPSVSNLLLQAVAMPANQQSNGDECLQMIAQPYYGTRLRYRSDYDSNDKRLGLIKNRTKHSNYQGPAIRIPSCYLRSNDEYYIRVCLVTAIYDKTQLRYIHPYIVEDPLNKEFNYSCNNSIYYPLQEEEVCQTGVKSFSSIRIVKKRASDLKEYGNLHVFDPYNEDTQQNHTLPQLSSVKDTITEYSLTKCQLAFTIAKKELRNGETFIVPLSNTTIFSDEMVEGDDNQSDVDNDSQLSNESSKTSVSPCRVYKYAPRYGFDTSNEDMVIFLTNKLEVKKYGALKVTFECNIPDGRWSQSVTDIDVKDRMVSFKTPFFPHSLEIAIAVDIKLQQTNRDLGTLKYFYISSIGQCSKCQLHAVENRTNTIPNISNKRSTVWHTTDDWQCDGVVPVPENSSEIQQSPSIASEQSSPSSVSAEIPQPARFSPIFPAETTEDQTEMLMTALGESVESLFINNNYTPLLRICRLFIKKRPEHLHDAIRNNHHDLLLKFLPIASIEILLQKNDVGENVLLHAVHLNRIELVKVLLDKKDSEKLIDDIDEKKNNIFHLMVLYFTSSEILQLLINYLLQKSISIREKFDRKNHDEYTPLQLSVSKNNLLVTKDLWKYFNTNVYRTENRSGDNLVHLAVRSGDLEMVKYLIEEGHLIQQGNQSNFTMTPMKLAQSFQRQDIFDYLNNKYPQEQIDKESSSSSSDDD